MPTSDEELAQLQTSVEEKRQRLAGARLERESNERALANDVTAAQLLAEAAQLDVLIASEEKAASKESVAAGAAVLMTTVQSDLEKAQAAQEGAVALAEAQAANQAAADEAKAAADAEAVAQAEAALAAASATENTEGGAS